MKKNPFNEIPQMESLYSDFICKSVPSFIPRDSFDERMKKHFMNIRLGSAETAGIVGNIKMESEMKPQFEAVKLELKPRSLSPEDIETIRKVEEDLSNRITNVLGMVCLTDLLD